VFVSHKHVDDPVEAAKHHFHKLGMHKTALRHSVLIFVAPRSQKFAILGDEAIHARCGEPFWQEVTQAMTGYFKQSQFTEAIEHGIAQAGQLLTRHFPRGSGDVNQSSDTVGHD
jgi:uncharacterized membrane protein